MIFWFRSCAGRAALFALSVFVLHAVTAPALEAQARVAAGNGAVLRALDKISGVVEDIEITAGHGVEFGRISIELRECRYPEGNPAGDAYAMLRVTEPEGDSGETVAFSGWMIASSPALNAMDHPRYDVWVLRCTTS